MSGSFADRAMMNGPWTEPERPADYRERAMRLFGEKEKKMCGEDERPGGDVVGPCETQGQARQAVLREQGQRSASAKMSNLFGAARAQQPGDCAASIGAPRGITGKEIGIRFTYHPPHGDQVDRYKRLRDLAGELAMEIMFLTPGGREQSLALTKLEEATMWANAAVAREDKR